MNSFLINLFAFNIDRFKVEFILYGLPRERQQLYAAQFAWPDAVPLRRWDSSSPQGATGRRATKPTRKCLSKVVADVLPLFRLMFLLTGGCFCFCCSFCFCLCSQTDAINTSFAFVLLSQIHSPVLGQRLKMKPQTWPPHNYTALISN